jgi:outer membrane protein assembly factor BamD (BamD/ComL family)
MNIGGYYFEVLGVRSGASPDEIKQAYRKLVRKNHPDLFPEPEKGLQELKMIQINEAYARITERLSPRSQYVPQWDEAEQVKNDEESQLYTESVTLGEISPDAVGFHRDVQYVYYKQGFENFSRAVSGIKTMETNVHLKNDLYYLRHFARSLYYLRKADMYFSTLLEEYPESIWAYDAYIKIKRIEFFNRFYRKILLNIERKLKEGRNGRTA